jgi:hypothetical protein
MLYLLILSLIAPLEPISWSELKVRLTIEPAEPDTVEVVEVVDAEDK